MPSLRRAGLILKNDRMTSGGYVGLKHNEDARSPQAAMEVFCLDREEANYLFYPDIDPCYCGGRGELLASPLSEASPKEVAEHIRRFVSWAKDKMKADNKAERKLKQQEEV